MCDVMNAECSDACIPRIHETLNLVLALNCRAPMATRDYLVKLVVKVIPAQLESQGFREKLEKRAPGDKLEALELREHL